MRLKKRLEECILRVELHEATIGVQDYQYRKQLLTSANSHRAEIQLIPTGTFRTNWHGLLLRRKAVSFSPFDAFRYIYQVTENL